MYLNIDVAKDARQQMAYGQVSFHYIVNLQMLISQALVFTLAGEKCCKMLARIRGLDVWTESLCEPMFDIVLLKTTLYYLETQFDEALECIDNAATLVPRNLYVTDSENN